MQNLLVLNSQYIYKEEEDGALLVNKYNGDVFLLNATASHIIRLCDGSNSMNDIIDSINNSFDFISSDNPIEDINVFIDALINKAFVIFQ